MALLCRAPEVLDILPADDGNGRAVGVDQRQGTEKGHIELALDRKIRLVVPSIGRFIAITRGSDRIAPRGLSSANVRLATREKILAGPIMDVWRKRRARGAVINRGPSPHLGRDVKKLPADATP